MMKGLKDYKTMKLAKKIIKQLGKKAAKKSATDRLNNKLGEYHYMMARYIVAKENAENQLNEPSNKG